MSELGLRVAMADSVVDDVPVGEYLGTCPPHPPITPTRSEHGDYPEGDRIAVLFDHQVSDHRVDEVGDQAPSRAEERLERDRFRRERWRDASGRGGSDVPVDDAAGRARWG
jgi:hypothetical protein